MIGPRYWATGITVSCDGRDGWGAQVDFYDDGHGDDDPGRGRISTEGTLRTRYFVGGGDQVDSLTLAIDTVKADAEKMGIAWSDAATVYFTGDGGLPDWPAPEGWRELVNNHAVRLGWQPAYRVDPGTVWRSGQLNA
ncbi:hypothetical protein FXF51_01640 [Nonomuraea sp. PA05]|uniref:hypothetical protein n=1 Tax=Nonomuraea sp. PA05 TaxID=2604466 RepID=UPI0011D60ACE|nr:hypothetical protein [Nonomuraea sp. PA05]TYB71164.1 hypothetical protein FXF51_01640 [Nonomuraea sp. PA05]